MRIVDREHLKIVDLDKWCNETQNKKNSFFLQIQLLFRSFVEGLWSPAHLSWLHPTASWASPLPPLTSGWANMTSPQQLTGSPLKMWPSRRSPPMRVTLPLPCRTTLPLLSWRDQCPSVQESVLPACLISLEELILPLWKVNRPLLGGVQLLPEEPLFRLLDK